MLCTAAIAAPAAQATFSDYGGPRRERPRVGGGQGAAVSPRLVPQPNQARGSDAYVVTKTTKKKSKPPKLTTLTKNRLKAGRM